MQMQTFLPYILIYMHCENYLRIHFFFLKSKIMPSFIFYFLCTETNNTFWWKLSPVSMTHASRMFFLCNTSAISQTSTHTLCWKQSGFSFKNVLKHYFLIWIEITYVVRACYCMAEWCASNFMLTGLRRQPLS